MFENGEVRNFIKDFQTDDMMKKYHIKTIEKTNVCYRGKNLLVPHIEFFIKDFIDEADKEYLENKFILAFQKYFGTDLKPGIAFRNSALWVREYKGKFFHLCVAEDSSDRNFSDYILYEVTQNDYNAILDARYAYCCFTCDERIIRRFRHTDEEYKEIWEHCLSEKLLRMIQI